MKGTREGALPDAEQRNRIKTELGVNMLVEAAAGTGKTTVLLERMVELIRTGRCPRVSNIAAITFTRKAAAELRSRFQVELEKKASKEEIVALWRSFEGKPQTLGLPSAPKPFLTYFEEENRPQTRLDRDAGGGMGVTIGRLRPDVLFDWRFVALSHNTVRGAAGAPC